MAIATTTPTGASFGKLVELGDKIVGAFASDPGKSRRQARDYDTGKPAVKGDGTARLEEVMHFVAMPGTTAKTGDADHGYEPIEPGTHIRFSVSGFKWGQVIDGRKNLPARDPFKAGQPCSGDVYEISLIGWSAETKNPTAAQAAGFTVVEGRIVMRTQEEKNKYVLHQSNAGGNTNPGKDLAITVRRPTADEVAWEKAADELYMTKPWELGAGDVAPADGGGDDAPPAEPF